MASAWMTACCHVDGQALQTLIFQVYLDMSAQTPSMEQMHAFYAELALCHVSLTWSALLQVGCWQQIQEVKSSKTAPRALGI